MEKPDFKKVLAVGAAMLTPLSLTRDEAFKPSSMAPHEIMRTAPEDSAVSRLVPDSKLHTQIEYQRAPRADSHSIEAVSPDTVTAEITQIFDTQAVRDDVGKPSLEKPATSAPLETKKTMLSLAEFEESFRQMISDTLSKKKKGTTLDSLVMFPEGSNLGFRARIKAKKGFVTFNIKVAGTIVDGKDGIVVGESSVDALMGVQGEAEKSINPLMKKLCSDLKRGLSGTYGRPIHSMHLSAGGVVVEFEPQ
jgi:hypothetical protein